MDAYSGLATLLVHADIEPHADHNAIAPPIYQGVPFGAASAAEFAEMSRRPRHERFYRRYGNPTLSRLEAVVAALEGAEAGIATASGMGAVSTAFLALLSHGDHVVAQRSMYGGTLGLLQNVAPRFGVEVTLVDQVDIAAFERAVTPRTRLVMVETPSNPLLQLTDLAAVAEMARDHGILTLADNTVATPVNQRPLEYGIDLVVHSVTKGLSGHSDVLGGIMLGDRELMERIWETHIIVGSVISPFDAWLALRGVRTLTMRVEQQNRNALEVARFLDEHPAVAGVNFPGLDTHPQHDLAEKQMDGYGGLLSFEMRGGYEAADRLVSALHLPARSASLGGVRSLVVQPAAMWAQDLTEDQMLEAGVAPGLVRLAVGLEDAEDLTSDLDRALEAAAGSRQ